MLFFRDDLFIDMCTMNRVIFWPLAVSLLFGLSIAAHSQTSTPTGAAGVTETAKPFDPAAATQAWLATVPREKREKSDAYFEGGYWLILWNFLLAAAISVFLLTSRISARMRDFAERATKFKGLQVACYAVPYLLIMYVLTFPLNMYEHFFRENHYGLATQSFLPWFREQLIALGLTLLGGVIALIVLYAVFRRAPRTWWLWGSVAAIIFSTVLVFITPLYIEPLFNTYKPVSNPEVRDPILAMARANEIPVKQVFEVDASRQTTRVSANVSGFLGTTRIALNDNLLKQCTLAEIRIVMAHEMGHYVLNHGAKLLTYFGIFILIGFTVACVLFKAAVRRGSKERTDRLAGIANRPVRLRQRPRGQPRRLDLAVPHDVANIGALGEQIVGDNPAMAAPPHRLGAHDRADTVFGVAAQFGEPLAKRLGHRVVGVIAERIAPPQRVRRWRRVLQLMAQPAQRADVVDSLAQ